MMRLRFAPSPTGYLHVGNARTALFNWLLARGGGGTFLLRIEDTDAERSTAASEASIFADLRWLGLTWDEGPDIGGPFAPYRQSERLAFYRVRAEQLLDQGLAYRCFCSIQQLDAERRAALESGHTTLYSGRCRTVTRAQAEARLAAGERAAIRFRVPASREILFEDAVRGVVRFNTDTIGDPVIVRSDGMPAYNFAVVIDDASMGVTHVIRGEDHISNTPRQLLLYEAFAFPPPIFAHLAMVLGPDHSPLSKRHGATSVAEFRSKGYLPEALVNYLALVGWSPRGAAAGDPHGGGTELMPIEEMARRFSLDAVGLSAGVFDEEKLAWVNRHYLKAASAERLAALSVEFLQAAGIDAHPDQEGLRFLAAAIPIASASVDRLDQVPARLSFLFDFDADAALVREDVREEMQSDGARAVVRAFAAALQEAPRLDRERFRAIANQVKASTGQKGKALFHPIRIALTARPDGPELDLAVPAIDLGAELPLSAGLPTIRGCRERALAFLTALEKTTREKT
jgi:nondiscriminating glutamyl-tRNA synthetase